MKSFLSILLLSHLALSAQESPEPAGAAKSALQVAKGEDCIRYHEKNGTASLETVVRRLASPTGQTVDLIGALHIADKSYYADLNERFTKYEAVLYEMVADPATAESLKDSKPSAAASGSAEPTNPLRIMQKMMGTALKLTFQLDQIDYSKKNFVHADMSPDEFSEEMKKRGENMMSMFAKAMEAERESGGGMTKGLEEIDPNQMLMMLMTGAGSDSLKIILAKAFDDSESMIGKFEGAEGSSILDGRNEKALAKLKEVVESGRKKVGIFYGAGHLPGMQQQLLKQGWKVTEESWLPAWTMKLPKAK
jgi:hypothetical protein